MDSRVDVYVENKARLDGGYSFGSVVFRMLERRGESFQKRKPDDAFCRRDSWMLTRGVKKNPIVPPTAGDETTLL